MPVGVLLNGVHACPLFGLLAETRGAQLLSFAHVRWRHEPLDEKMGRCRLRSPVRTRRGDPDMRVASY